MNKPKKKSVTRKIIRELGKLNLSAKSKALLVSEARRLIRRG